MIRNSLICKLINVQASMKENNEKKIKNEDEMGIHMFEIQITDLQKQEIEEKRCWKSYGWKRKKNPERMCLTINDLSNNNLMSS